MFSIFKSKEEKVTDQYVSAIVTFMDQYAKKGHLLKLGFDNTLKKNLITLVQKEDAYANLGYKTIDYFSMFENTVDPLQGDELYLYSGIKRVAGEKPVLYAADYLSAVTSFYTEYDKALDAQK